VKITSLVHGANTRLQIVFKVDDGYMAPVSNGTYAVSTMLDGSFTRATVSGPPKLSYGCPDPGMFSPPNITYAQLMMPCAQWRLEVNEDVMNEYGVDQTATLSLPCWPSLGHSGPSPCGTFLSRYGGDGAFKMNDRSRKSCDQLTCNPYHKVTLTAFFAQKDQTLRLPGSGIVAMSPDTEENFGHEQVAVALASDWGAPLWVSFTSTSEPYRAISKGLIPSKEGTEFAFALQKAEYTPAVDGITLTSIATITGDATTDDKDAKKGDETLPTDERQRNDRSYASFIAVPGQLRWGSVGTLRLDYKFVVSESSPSGDPRLGNLKFQDCQNAAFYVLVALVDEKGDDVRKLKIRLGESDDFARLCAGDVLSGKNLITENDDRRVDVSGLPGKLFSVRATQDMFRDLYVRSISVVVDRGTPDSPTNEAHYKVELYEGNVEGVKTTASLLVVDEKSYEDVTELPAHGRSMLFSDLNKLPNIEIAKTTDAEIRNVDDMLQGTVPAGLLRAKGKTFRVDLCLFGGRCIPLQGSFNASD